MEHILDALQVIRSGQQTAVLTTIVHVAGSAYRREGAKMLFLANGEEKGTLSAGCLESDLAFRAQAAFEQNTALLHTYDMAAEDDFTWGRGSGCNGVITVLIEPLGVSSWQQSNGLWSAILDAYLQGQTVTVLRKLSGRPENDEPMPVRADAFLMLHGDGSWSGSLQDAQLDARFKPLVQDFHRREERSQATWEGDELFVFERIFPKDRLFIFGAGPDSEPVVAAMSKLGFEVTVIDPRPVRLRPEIFPDAHRLIESHPEQAAQKVELPEGSYAIVMTHSFQSDRVWLSYLNQHHLRYVGVLGPRARTLRLLSSREMPLHYHAPIGLDIGAEGPDEIAVSIAAEIIRVRRGKK